MNAGKYILGIIGAVIFFGILSNMNFDDFKKSDKDEKMITFDSPAKSNIEAYELLSGAFENRPSTDQIRKLIDRVMENHRLEINYVNINKCGSTLIRVKELSAIGVTEMDILKHMYQYGDHTKDFPTQAAISASYLEQNN